MSKNVTNDGIRELLDHGHVIIIFNDCVEKKTRLHRCRWFLVDLVQNYIVVYKSA